MKIYDVLPFFNELDILEIRLQELWNTVDYFVITESNLSHSGKPKDYILLDNWERFKPYEDKIRHIKVEDMPETKDSWMRERHQRRVGTRGLTDLQPEDIVIVSDCDEIARSEIIDLIKTDENQYDRYILNIPQFQYRLNYMKFFPHWKNANIAVTRGAKFIDPQVEREFTFYWNPKPENTVSVEHGGWHFTYYGDDEHAIKKIQNFAHTETDTPDMIARHNIEWFIENKYGHHGPNNSERFEIVQVDEYFPECVTKNLDKYKSMIVPNAALHVTDLYRL